MLHQRSPRRWDAAGERVAQFWPLPSVSFFPDKLWAQLRVAADGGPLPISSRGRRFSSGGRWKWSRVVLSQARPCQLPSGPKGAPTCLLLHVGLLHTSVQAALGACNEINHPDYCWHPLSWYSWFSVAENGHIWYYKNFSLPKFLCTATLCMSF